MVSIDRRDNYKKLFVIGPIFLIMAVYDYFFFRMHPAQENLFVQDVHKSSHEKQVFDMIASAVKHKNDTKRNSVSVFDVNRPSQSSVSFLMAFKDPKIY